MPFCTVLDPNALSMLSDILDSHCAKHGIMSSEGRESAASSLLAHYQNGTRSVEDLTQLLEFEDAPRGRRAGG